MRQPSSASAVFGCGSRSSVCAPTATLPPLPELAPAAVRLPLVAPADVPLELDLRGRTAQEAREAVRAFIDDATLAGHDEVRVIHGRGTGAIRKAVRDELGHHPLAGESVSDSADGATVVRLGGPRDQQT